MGVWGAQCAVTKSRLQCNLTGDPVHTITVCQVQYAGFWKLSSQWKSEIWSCHFERAESNWNLPEAGSPEVCVLPLLQQPSSQCTRLKCHITARVSGDYVCSNEKSVLQTRLFSVGFCFLAFLNLILYPWTKLKFVLHEFQKRGISGSQGILWRARKLQFHPGSGTDLLLCDFREDIQHEIQVSAFTWVRSSLPVQTELVQALGVGHSSFLPKAGIWILLIPHRNKRVL